ncbi:MAG: hypothetical protein P4L35_04460 [Ignavibacteriaceae bacterium]|nr:hypothetical protein [Ignavibacteriaceae bacterium]
MNYEKAIHLLSEIESSKLYDLKKAFYSAAINYAKIRMDYYEHNSERTSLEQQRTLSHNVFIDECNILSRTMINNNENALWRKELGSNRKEIGDFACFVALLKSFETR